MCPGAKSLFLKSQENALPNGRAAKATYTEISADATLPFDNHMAHIRLIINRRPNDFEIGSCGAEIHDDIDKSKQ